MISDDQYLEFMKKLSADQHGANPLMTLDDFKKSFLGSFRSQPRASFFFSDKRRGCTDRMWRKHGPDLNFPHPLDAINGPPKIPDADPAGCQYLVREDGRPQRRCNEPVVCQEPRKLKYCQAHREQVERAVKGTIFIPL